MSELKRTTEPALEEDREHDQEAGAEAEAEATEADGKRGRRRSKTMSRKEIARDLRRQMAFGIIDPELEAVIREIEESRPRSRADCAGGPRPCLFISCKHHLYLDVNPGTGSIKLNFPDKEIWELNETCALDVADRGGITLEAGGRGSEGRGVLEHRENPELYFASSADDLRWVHLATLKPSGEGTSRLSAEYTLPPGALQAVRGRYRFGGVPSPCGDGEYDDVDDLVFDVAP